MTIVTINEVVFFYDFDIIECILGSLYLQVQQMNNERLSLLKTKYVVGLQPTKQ